MSVPKGKRSMSEIAFYDEAYRLHSNIIRYLLNDFGIKKGSYDYHIFANRTKMSKEDKEKFGEIVEKYGIDVESDYVRYIIYHYRDIIIDLLDSMITNITRAYTIYPNTEEEWDMRRRYQNQAITDITSAKTQFTIAIKELPVNFEKYVPFVKQMDDEIAKLKQWRGDCNKQKIKCIENDIEKRLIAEKNVADAILENRSKQRQTTVADEVIRISNMNFNNNFKFPKFVMDQSYLNYVVGNYTLNFNDYGRIMNSTNPIPCLLSIDQYGNSIAPVY